MVVSLRSFSLFLCVFVLCVSPLLTHARRTRPSKYASPEYNSKTFNYAPLDAQQVHISLTGVIGDGQIVVNWLTFNMTQDSTVLWGTSSGNYNNKQAGVVTTFVDPNPAHTIRYIHNSFITSLQPGETVYYRVGSLGDNRLSPEFNFTFPNQGQELVRMAVYGDMGVVNSQSMQNLANEVANHQVDIVLHIGDFAYNMDEVEGATGDTFLNEMQAIAALAPYMGCPGNHEDKYNFTHYNYRFNNWAYMGQVLASSHPASKPLPAPQTHRHSTTGLVAATTGATGQNWWNSWEYISGGSKIHMVSIDTEVYYNLLLLPQRIQQYNWLQQDLKQARQNGADWLIVYGHRPLYCSNVDDMPDCSTDAEELRIGLIGGYGIEDLLVSAGVDVYFTAHEHSYERTFPVYKGKWQQYGDASSNGTYIDPSYPTHIITGSGGCRELNDFYDAVMHGGWSSVRSSTYGYGHLVVHNSTHLYWEQLLAEGAGGTDEMWIIKTAHGQAKKHKVMAQAQKRVSESTRKLAAISAKDTLHSVQHKHERARRRAEVIYGGHVYSEEQYMKILKNKKQH